MKVLVFGGTTEGRIAAKELCGLGLNVTVSVATPLGAEELEHISGIEVSVGRLDEKGIENLLEGFGLCVDATHPYAAEVSENIKNACKARGVPLRRILRKESGGEADCKRFKSCGEAAEFLEKQSGNILLATGAKELPSFAKIPAERIFARVLPTAESISACEKAGIPHGHILALQGPFSQKLNEAMLEQYSIRWFVTKDGGSSGGFSEKAAAAKSIGAELILIDRPAKEAGIEIKELVDELRGKEI